MSVPPLPTPVSEAPLPVLGALPSRWTPPTDNTVTQHTVDPLPPNRLYIAGPPLEIGKIRSAFSNMDADKGADGQINKRIQGALGGLLGGIFLTWVIGFRIGLWGFLDPSLWILGFGGIIGIIVGYVGAKPKYVTSYVGEDGVASFHYGGKNAHVGKSEIFLFRQGAVLKVQQTRQFYNGVYTGTTYSFIWNDVAGKVAHKINGTYKNKEGRPPAEDPYWYGVAAENAWSRSQMSLLTEKVAEGETVLFPVQGKGAVGVSQQGLVIQIGGKQEIVPVSAISDLGIKNGEVTITRAGAKKGFLGIGADGVYKFPYSNLGNARIFLALLARAVGVTEPEGGDTASSETPETSAASETPAESGTTGESASSTDVPQNVAH